MWLSNEENQARTKFTEPITIVASRFSRYIPESREKEKREKKNKRKRKWRMATS